MPRDRPARPPRSAFAAGPDSARRPRVAPASVPFAGDVRVSPRAPATSHSYRHPVACRLPERSTTCPTPFTIVSSAVPLSHEHAAMEVWPAGGGWPRPTERPDASVSYHNLTLQEEGDDEGVQRGRLHQGQTDDEGRLGLAGRVGVAAD